MEKPRKPYRGRLAPTPSGWLHLGHARTFASAWRRARERRGTLVYRCEDIDLGRCKPEFERAAEEDLAWLGLDWDEGGGKGGPFAPYRQSERFARYEEARLQLIADGFLYAAPFSRKEISERATGREEDGTWKFSKELRPKQGGDPANDQVNWRFRVPDGEEVVFRDERLGEQRFVAGRDFGDFLVWRKERAPSYELAVVVDDAAMEITEVVRGEDLLLSTARQLLLYRALGRKPPRFRHEELVRDETGKRLSKTAGSLAIRELRKQGKSPEEVLSGKL